MHNTGLAEFLPLQWCSSYTFHLSPEAKPPTTKTHHFFRPCKNTRDLNNLENSTVSLMLYYYSILFLECCQTTNPCCFNFVMQTDFHPAMKVFNLHFLLANCAVLPKLDSHALSCHLHCCINIQICGNHITNCLLQQTFLGGLFAGSTTYQYTTTSL